MKTVGFMMAYQIFYNTYHFIISSPNSINLTVLRGIFLFLTWMYCITYSQTFIQEMSVEIHLEKIHLPGKKEPFPKTRLQIVVCWIQTHRNSPYYIIAPFPFSQPLIVLRVHDHHADILGTCSIGNMRTDERIIKVGIPKREFLRYATILLTMLRVNADKFLSISYGSAVRVKYLCVRRGPTCQSNVN